MTHIENFAADLAELKQRVLLVLIGKTDTDSEHLANCASLIQQAIDELQDVEIL